jgi:ABC-2 type transport system permease protein
MWTFKAYFKKEILESIRQYKYIMLAAGILLFALLDPLLLKALPDILKNQLPADISALFVTTQKTAVQSYIKQLNQVGMLFVIFVFSGTLSDEIYNQKLVFPYSKGARPASIVLAKLLNYAVTIGLLVFVGFAINYYYITILFDKDPISFINIIPAIALVYLYYIFNISLTLLLSSIFKRGLVGGIIALAAGFTTSALAGIESIGKFVPYNLINQANSIILTGESEGITTIIFTLILSVVFITLTIVRMNKVEVI